MNVESFKSITEYNDAFRTRINNIDDLKHELDVYEQSQTKRSDELLKLLQMLPTLDTYGDISECFLRIRKILNFKEPIDQIPGIINSLFPFLANEDFNSDTLYVLTHFFNNSPFFVQEFISNYPIYEISMLLEHDSNLMKFLTLEILLKVAIIPEGSLIISSNHITHILQIIENSLGATDKDIKFRLMNNGLNILLHLVDNAPEINNLHDLGNLILNILKSHACVHIEPIIFEIYAKIALHEQFDLITMLDIPNIAMQVMMNEIADFKSLSKDLIKFINNPYDNVLGQKQANPINKSTRSIIKLFHILVEAQTYDFQNLDFDKINTFLYQYNECSREAKNLAETKWESTVSAIFNSYGNDLLVIDFLDFYLMIAKYGQVMYILEHAGKELLFVLSDFSSISIRSKALECLWVGLQCLQSIDDQISIFNDELYQAMIQIFVFEYYDLINDVVLPVLFQIFSQSTNFGEKLELNNQSVNDTYQEILKLTICEVSEINQQAQIIVQFIEGNIL